jgi:hypothetical protein
VAVQHLLILGAPRSGTTLLTAMIGRHSEVAVLNEDKGWAMRSIVGKQVIGNKRCIPNQIELQRPSCFRARFLKTWGFIAEYQSSRYSIEDYLGLPNIKIVGLIRDGNDVVASNMRRAKKSLDGAAYRWCRAIEILYDLKKRHDEIVIIVSFENLVLDPRANMERIARFLGLKFEERMLEGPQYNAYYPGASFDESKVMKSTKEKIGFDLERRLPSASEKFKELMRCSR